MNLRQNGSSWTQQAPAKLNLFLEVLGQRPDGYHELETLLVPVRLYDSLTLTPLPANADGSAGPIELSVRISGQLVAGSPGCDELPRGRENLVVRALELLRQRSGTRLGSAVELVKRIPLAAGLGGGSSDAAAALKLANRGWKLGWENDQLRELAAELGSDVPFFLTPGAAVCRGRGERVESLSGVWPLDLVIFKPPAGLSTADVFRSVDAVLSSRSSSSDSLIAALRKGCTSDVGRRLRNRLQAAAARLSPLIERARAAFADLDFAGHQLSGSGTAYFGVCRHAQHARRLATILRKRQQGLVYVTRSCP